MAKTLAQYLIDTRRLIRDANAQYWTDTDLTDYINEARVKVATETACVRQFQNNNPLNSTTPITLTPGKDKYLYTDILPNGINTIDIINVILLWGQTRVQLTWWPFSEFSAYFRIWQSFQQLPIAFTLYGPNILWIAPIPAIAYAGEFDTAIIPVAMANDGSADPQIPAPYGDAVKYYSARLAKMNMQQWEEAGMMDSLYKQEIDKLNSMYPRRIPNVYSTEGQTL